MIRVLALRGRGVRGSVPLVVAALAAVAPATASAITTQTITDPLGGEPVAGMPLPDNCRVFNFGPMGDRTECGPDITQVVFSTPGDGNLHIDITYAALPRAAGGLAEQTVQNVEVGLYPKTATVVDGLWDRRVSSTALGFAVNKPPTVFGSVNTIPRPLGIELLVPFAAIGGDPALWRYVVNAGIVGEVVPEHPELVPNAGFIDLTGDAAPATPTPQPPLPEPQPPLPPHPDPVLPVEPAEVRALISPLAGILPVQRGPALNGTVKLTGDADQITVEAFVRPAMLRAPTAAAAPPLKRIGVFTKRNVKTGKVKFSVPLTRATRAKLAVRPATAITLRVTLRVGQTKGVRSKQVTWKRPVPRP